MYTYHISLIRRRSYY